MPDLPQPIPADSAEAAALQSAPSTTPGNIAADSPAAQQLTAQPNSTPVLHQDAAPSLQTPEQYANSLDTGLGPNSLASAYLKNKDLGSPVDPEIFRRAYVAKVPTANFWDDAPPGTPKTSILSKVGNIISSVYQGTKTQLSDVATAVKYNWAKAGTPEADLQRQAMANVEQGTALHAVQLWGALSRTASWVANKTFPEQTLTHDATHVFTTPTTRFGEQFDRDVSLLEAQQRIMKGHPLGIEAAHQNGAPDIQPQDNRRVEEISQSFLQPEMLLPFGVAERVAGTTAAAKAMTTLAEASPNLAKSVVARVAAKIPEGIATVANSTMKVADESPLLRAVLAGGATAALGGEPGTQALAAILGSSSKLAIVDSALGQVAQSATKLAAQMSGEAELTGTAKFAAGLYRAAVGDAGKALVAGQFVNLPFVLGASNREEAEEAIINGLVFSAAGVGAGKLHTGLDFARNYWEAQKPSSTPRQQIKSLGVDPLFDQRHEEAMADVGNTGNNLVEGVRKYLGSRAENYVMSSDDIKASLGELKAAGVAEMKDWSDADIAAASKQYGLTLPKVTMLDGTSRSIAFTQLSDVTPGLGFGHETTHLLRGLLSDEEFKPVADLITSWYGEKGLSEAKSMYEKRAELSGQPSKPLTRDEIIEEIFADHGSGILNSIPMGEFGPEQATGARKAARAIYASLETVLNRVGAKVPSTDPTTGASVKTGLGYDPSAPLGQLIENILAAKKLDRALQGLSTEAAPISVSSGPFEGVREVAPEPAFKTGTPIEEVKTGNKIIAKDGKITRVLERQPGEPQKYELEYTDPADGKRKAAIVEEKTLQSPIRPGAAEPVVKPAEVNGVPAPRHPVTSETAPSVAEKIATKETVRPQVDTPPIGSNVILPSKESKPNVRVTPDQQTSFAQKAAPGLVRENTAVLRSATMQPRSKIPVMETDYFSAKSDQFAPDAIVRGEQRRLADEADSYTEKTGKPNPLRAIYQKLFVPYQLLDGPNPRVYGFSLDKVIQNSDILRGWLAESVTGTNPLVQVRSRLGDSQFANTVHQYLENQRNGYGGDGNIIIQPADAKPGSITSANPDYTPTKLSESDKQLVNLLMGIEVPKTNSAGSRFAARMARENGLTPTLDRNGVEVTNPLRLRLEAAGFNPKLLNSAVENLPVANFTTPLKVRSDLKSMAGDVAITRAGFMPADTAIDNRDTMQRVKTRSTLRKQGNDETRAVAASYIKENHLGTEQHSGYAPVNEDMAKRLADHYEQAAHDPENPDVQRAYGALADETMQQYEAMKAAGIKIEPYDGKGEPYPSSTAMMQDVRDNKHLFFLKTEGNFSGDQLNPMLRDSGVKIAGQKLLVNDVFRAVHDYFGHTAEGFEFGPRGEYNAYLAHSKMFSDEAVPALAAETLAQNSYVNYGSHLRRADGSLPVKGDIDFKPLSERPFAEQKNLLVPEEFIREADLDTRATIRRPEARPPRAEPAEVAFLPAQHVGKPLEHSLGDETLRLVHYGQPGQKIADPARFGKSGITSQSELAGAPRSYFYEKGRINKSDPAVARKDIYETAVSGARIYDGDTDALGYSGIINREKADTMLKDEGYVGIARTSGGAKKGYRQVELFKPTKLEPSAANFMPAVHEGRDVLGVVKGDEDVTLHTLPKGSEKTHEDLGLRGDKFRYNTSTHKVTWTDLREETTPTARRAAQETLERKGYSVAGHEDWSGHPYGNLSVGHFMPGDTVPADKPTDVLDSRSYKSLAKHLTPAEQENVRRDVAQEMVDLYKTLPDDKEFEAAAQAGMAKKGWYKRASDSIKFIFGDDTEKFVALLAAMSPQQSVQENLHMSLKTWADWQDAGRPLDTASLTEIVERHADIHARVPNSVRAFQGYDMAEPVKKSLEPKAHLSGLKVESFRKNLLGDFTPSTNDTWMAMFANVDQTMFSKKSGYLAFNAKVRKVAAKLDLHPAEVQETVWSFFKTLLDSTTVKRSARKTLAELTESDILNTPEFHEELIRNPKIKAQLERLGFTGFDQLANRENSQRAEPRPGSLSQIALSEGGPGRLRILNRIADRAQRIKDAAEAETARVAPPETADVGATGPDPF